MLRSSLKDHKRVGKELVPPFLAMDVPMTQVFWARDLLPEFLWIDSLVNFYGEAAGAAMFRDFMTAADNYHCDTDRFLDGTMSAFALIAGERRQQFLSDCSLLVRLAVDEPFGEILALLTSSDMAWLGTRTLESTRDAIQLLRQSVNRLIPGKDEHAGFCRALPLHRYFKHNRVMIVDTLTELIEAIEQYPKGDRWHVESYARQVHDSDMLDRAGRDPGFLAWSRRFWRFNADLAECHHE